MVARRSVLFLAAIAISSMGASYRTPNFIVHAPTEQIAQQVGQHAERYRREKALEWLGQEMNAWGQPCTLRVTITPGGPGGATTFAFDRGAILSQEMNVQGSLERVLNSVLPHEVTHTVFAYKFRCPVPRWADEGGSVLSEDDVERKRHDQMVRQCLAGGRAFRLRTLFEMKQYPTDGGDVMTLYAQGYSLARFLVETTSRPQFLAFVGDGMRQGWDYAVQTHLHMSRVEDLEEAWLSWMRGTFRPRSDVLARNAKATSDPSPSKAGTAGGIAAQLGRPEVDAIVRGASPDEPANHASSPVRRDDSWSPAATPGARRTPPVTLKPPQPEAPSQAQRALQYPPRP